MCSTFNSDENVELCGCFVAEFICALVILVKWFWAELEPPPTHCDSESASIVAAVFRLNTIFGLVLPVAFICQFINLNLNEFLVSG